MDDKVNWISVGELADSFAPDANVLSRSAELAGTTLDLAFESGEAVTYDFLSDSRLRWRIAGGVRGSQGAEESYLATGLRPNLYFVDYIKGSIEPGTSVSLVLDFDAEVATAVVGRLPDATAARDGLLARAQRQEELTAVEARFLRASIGATYDSDAAHHAPTTDLVGLRIRHRYNPHELYEHIYLNDSRYCWHCIEGAEQGLGDVDRCHYHAVRSGLYLFVWREKVIPTLGVVLLDLDALKTTGKILGYADNDLASLSNFPVGAHSTIANRTPRTEKVG